MGQDVFSYFLKRLSNAVRASEGLVTDTFDGVPPPESRVSRSIDVLAMKNSQVLPTSFFVMRCGIGSVHSN